MPELTIISLDSIENDFKTSYRLAVDGTILNGPKVTAGYRLGQGFHLTAWKQEIANIVFDLPLSELRKLFAVVSVNLEPKIHDFFGLVDLIWKPNGDGPSLGISFWPNVELENWARPYSIAELSDVIQKQIKADQESGAEFFTDPSAFPRSTPNFAITLPIPDSCDTIRDLIAYYAHLLEEILEKSVQSLLVQARRDSLVTFFEFPRGIRTACQQYLVYFVQFLADLGIDADAEIKEDAKRILFSVTPRDGNEALERIQEALQAFLSLPGSGEIKSYAVTTSDIATQQLVANVMHLESQLALAHAIDQAKSATIESLQLTNYQYRQMLLTASPPNLSPASTPEGNEPDREEFFDGTVAVTSYKGKGFEVNIPKLLRKLRRRFS